jgi:dTDP-4-dehydrorhamnose 3,5-epimerase
MDPLKGSWQAPFEVRDLVLRADARGRLFEILRFVDDAIEGQGQLYTFSVNPGHRRGDHYHLIKGEWFTCVHGRVKVLLDDRQGRTAVIEQRADRPSIVYAAPGTVHALINQTSEVGVVVSYGSQQHHPDAPDTYFEIAVKDFTLESDA